MPARRLPLGFWIGLSLVLHFAVASWLSSQSVVSSDAPFPTVSPIRVVAKWTAPNPMSPPVGEATPQPDPTPKPVPVPVETTPPPRPPEPARSETLKPPPVAEPPPPISAPPPLPVETLAPTPSAPIASGAPSDLDELDLYEDTVRQEIAAHREYPRQARRRGIEGAVTIQLAIDENGALLDVDTVGRAPSILAKQAIGAVHKAEPFPAPPHGRHVKIKFTVDYNLDD